MEFCEIAVNEKQGGQRIDKVLREVFSELSRSYIHKLIENKLVKVNSKEISKSYKLSPNDAISITLPDPEPTEILPENIPLDVIYEDSDLLIVNKPKNMVVHPAPGNISGTLVNALLYYCKDSLSGINGVLRPGIVHRIDKNTSGLLLVAKNDSSHKFLAEQIKNHSFTREYRAVAFGKFKKNKGTVSTQIGRSKIDRKKMTVLEVGGKSAVTHYEVLEEYANYSYIKLQLETGRTHQIRVHMAYVGHPIVGDEVYGPKNQTKFKFLCGQCLHAKTIGFVHPSTQKYVEFSSELPEYFQKIVAMFERG